VTGGEKSGHIGAASAGRGVRVRCGPVGVTSTYVHATSATPSQRAARARSAAAEEAGRRRAKVCGRGAHRDYVRRRARQVAYGRWRPWAQNPDLVRAHVNQLRQGGASYRALARAGGVSPMTVLRLQRGVGSRAGAAPTRVRADHAQRLLVITADSLVEGRRDATGTRRRLRALTAVGHPAVSLACRLDVPSRVVWDIVRGRAASVTPAMHAAVRDLYDQIWDLRPPERTRADRRAAAAARTRAARHGWPAPMGLDDDRIDDPSYDPRTGWRPGTGVGVAAFLAMSTWPGPGEGL
jgi:hypothetical protein